MRKILSIVVLFVLILAFDITTCFADNPIVQTIYTADPAPMVYDGRCYLYTTHDEDTIVNNFYTMNDWRCYSSDDMVNWIDHGSPLSYSTFSWGQGDAWAAQCVYKNGKFYMYVPMTRKNSGGARVIGVAVSDSPTGPFTDALGKPLITNNGAQDIDPSVYIDDNGQAYLYWGNGNLYYVKLNQDMISYSGGVVQVSSKPTSFTEGPWFYKRDNLYYMVYAGMGGNGNEDIRYATSTSPTGPWNYKGVIMGSQNSFTNHPGVIDFKGNSYFFYHTGDLPGGGSYHRSVCVEQFKYNSDGTIPSIPMTKNGPAQLGNLNPYIKNEAETICWESGIETEKCSEGGMDVCNVENGDYIKVKGVDFGSGAVSFDARVASAASGGKIELRLDSPTGTLVGTCTVSGTGGWQTWATKSCTVSGATGIHDLYLKFTGGSGSLFNFNWWKFTGTDPIVSPTLDVTPTFGVTPTPTTIPSGKSPFTKIEAEDFDDQSGIKTETCSEGGEDVGYIENGDYVVYNNINFGNGASSFEARVASAASGGNIEIRLDSITGTLIGTCSVTGTGDWQTWVNATCNISGVSGIHDLYLKFTGGSSYLFNLNWWKFNPNTSTPTSTPTSMPTSSNSPDLNNDGVVNMADVIILAGAFNSVRGESKYVAAYDLNNDGAINISDVIIIAGSFNKIITPATPMSATPTPTAKQTPTSTAVAKFHCYLLLGQSNMAGYANAQASDKVEDPRVLVLGYDNNSALGRVTDQWDVACPPLHPAWLDAVGPGDWFGKSMIQKVPAGDTIGLIPCAISGEKIETFMKNGGTKYSWIINRAKLAQQKGGVIEGIIFHQGESNSGDTSWPGKVKTLVEDLRKDLNLGNVPFLAGELLYSGPCAGHNTLVNQLPSLITNCHVVSAQGLVQDPSDTTYRLHFSHDSTVELGKRYAEKMIEVLGW